MQPWSSATRCLTVVAVIGAALFVAPALASSTRPSLEELIAPGATVTLFGSVEPPSTGGNEAEGPLWLPDGRLIATDVGADTVVAFGAAGDRRVFRAGSNRASGTALDPGGAVVLAERGSSSRRGVIARIAADGSTKVLATGYHGKRFNSPNDLIVKRDGSIWFTDPDYGQESSPVIPFHGVFRLDPGSGRVTLVTDNLAEPNGIAFSPDQRTLYVSDSATIEAFTVYADGTVGAQRRFGQIGDGGGGIAVDARGDVWATTCGTFLHVLDPMGAPIGEVAFPDRTTNLAWGGRHGTTLFVTTSRGGVYRLALTLPEAR